MADGISPIDPQHPNVYVALAAAQAEMGPALKGSKNPHFKSMYANLADVVAAARPALNSNGIAFFHFIKDKEMVTVLMHGESQTCVECAVPLMVEQNNMQKMKSATTYAKRIGLESLTGLAPEDDDGNAASQAPAKKRAMPRGEVGALDQGDQSNRDVKESVKKLTDSIALIGGMIEWEEWPSDAFEDGEIISDKIARLPEDYRENVRAIYKQRKLDLQAMATA